MLNSPRLPKPKLKVSAVSVMLAKKAEGRPLNPEDYEIMGHFVDRVEKRSAARHIEKPAVEDQRLQGTRTEIPPEAYETNILDSSLPQHVSVILQEAGYATVGDLAERMKTQPDDVFRLQGIGPKAMTQIMSFMDTVYVAPVTAEDVEEEAEVVDQLPEGIEEVAPLATDEAILAEDVVDLETVQAAEEALTEERPLEADAILDIEAPEGIETAPAEEQVEEEPSFDELFALKPELVEPVEFEEEEEDDEPRKARRVKRRKRNMLKLNTTLIAI
jgi:transcription termination/antitermination protein NusA